MSLLDRVSRTGRPLTIAGPARRAALVDLLAMTPEIAVRSTRPGGGFHGDPADRIIVATGLEHRARWSRATNGSAATAPSRPSGRPAASTQSREWQYVIVDR
ncbi:MAG: PIN domain-containing protein [Myxococcales bacterium]